jgi:hypothetical protein
MWFLHRLKDHGDVLELIVLALERQLIRGEALHHQLVAFIRLSMSASCSGGSLPQTSHHESKLPGWALREAVIFRVLSVPSTRDDFVQS